MGSELPESYEYCDRLCRSIAGKVYRHASHQHSMDDLVSEGWVGLLHAARKYEPSCGVRFNTFATRRIYGQIIDYLRADSWMPRAVMDKVKRGELKPVRIGSFSEYDNGVCDVATYIERTTIDDLDELEVIMRNVSSVSKKMLALYYLEDMTMKEIAVAEGVGVAAVSLRIKTAMHEILNRRNPWG